MFAECRLLVNVSTASNRFMWTAWWFMTFSSPCKANAALATNLKR
jgi:hypothetical protein